MGLAWWVRWNSSRKRERPINGDDFSLSSWRVRPCLGAIHSAILPTKLVTEVNMQVQSLSDKIFFNTVRIDTSDGQGGHGSGTGFFFHHKSGDQDALCIVTNKHVCFGGREGRFTFTKSEGGEPKLGEVFHLSIGESDWKSLWFGHPDDSIDIAICPLLPLLETMKSQYGFEAFYKHITSGTIPNDEEISSLNSIEEVTFVGYPNGVWDGKNYLPIARKGTTASPVEVDFEGTPKFLIDASVFGGSSGSPVYILNDGVFSDRNGKAFVGKRFYFIGVIAAVFFRTQENSLIAKPIPTNVIATLQQQEMIDLGIVFKSRTVVETVEAAIKAGR